MRELLLKEDIDIIVCNPNQQRYVIGEEMLKYTSVRAINTCSTGLNHIDLDYCKSNNITIQSHKNDYKLINDLPSTAELAFALMMNLLRKVTDANKHVRGYGWNYTKFIGHQLKGLNVGLVGYGRLGKMMYKYCEAFGANVTIYDPYVKDTLSDAFLLNHWCSSLTKLFSRNKVISLHVHVTDETKHMINKKVLQSANKSYLINTSRGDIVDEKAVVEALKKKQLLGYGTDVVEAEFNEGPLTDTWDSPIINAMHTPLNIITTPHVGGMTWEGQEKAYLWSINKIKELL